MALRQLLRNLGLKVGAISRERFEARIRELVEGNTLPETASAPILHIHLASCLALVGLVRLVRQTTNEGPVCLRLNDMSGIGAVVALT